MHKPLFDAMFFVLSVWLYLFFIFTGLGLLIRRLFGLRINNSGDLLLSFWVGWAFTIFFLQLWHIFFPVNSHAFILVSAAGFSGLIYSYQDIRSLLKKNVSINLPICFFVFIAALILSNRAIMPPVHYDSGLYHFNSVRWATAFPIVPGLGNLHGMLALNNSYFLYLAMLEIGNWVHKSHHLANGLLLLVFLAQISLTLSNAFKSPEKIKLHHIFSFLILFPVLTSAFDWFLSSPSTDFSIFILGLLLSVQFLAFLEYTKIDSKEASYSVLFITILISLGITIKLTFIFLGFLTFTLMLFTWIKRRSKEDKTGSRNTLFWIFAVLATSLIPWMVRGVILSGYLAYPFPFGSFPVEWRVPHATLINIVHQIRGWALKTFPDWDTILIGWDWFGPWLMRMMSYGFEVRMPLLFIFVGCFLILLHRKLLKSMPKVIWLFFLPLLASLILWFSSAPTIRYLGAPLWSLGAGAMAFGLGYFVITKEKLKLFFVYYLLFILIYNLLSIPSENKFALMLIKEKNIVKAFSELALNKNIINGNAEGFGFDGIPRAELREFLTHSGLVLYAPKKGNQLWDSPLPATPHPNLNLRLIKEGELRYGFIVYPVKDSDPDIGIDYPFSRKNY